MSRVVLCLVTAVSLGGCVAAPADPLVFVRTDGQTTRGNQALEQQFEIDRTICVGQSQQASAVAAPIYAGGIVGGIMQAQRNDALADVAKGCMAQKGYVQVRESQRVETEASFARTAKERLKAAPKA